MDKIMYMDKEYAGYEQVAQMTIAEAETGTSETSRLISPKVLHDYVEGVSVDKVIEETTSGIWKIRKWESGILEAWGNTSDSYAMTTLLVTPVYYGYKAYDLTSLGLISIDSIQVTGNCAALYTCTKIESYSTTLLILTAMSVASRTDTIDHSISIKGRWKQ